MTTDRVQRDDREQKAARLAADLVRLSTTRSSFLASIASTTVTASWLVAHNNLDKVCLTCQRRSLCRRFLSFLASQPLFLWPPELPLPFPLPLPLPPTATTTATTTTTTTTTATATVHHTLLVLLSSHVAPAHHNVHCSSSHGRRERQVYLARLIWPVTSSTKGACRLPRCSWSPSPPPASHQFAAALS